MGGGGLLQTTADGAFGFLENEEENQMIMESQHDDEEMDDYGLKTSGSPVKRIMSPGSKS